MKACSNDLVGVYVGEKEDRGSDYQSPVLPKKEFVVFDGQSFVNVAKDAVGARVAPVFAFGIVDGYKDHVGECKDDHPYS